MHHWFMRGLEHSPDGLALRMGNIVRSYSEVHLKCARWASRLRRVTPEPPRRIGILAGQNEVRYTGLLAAAYAGATAVPVNPRWPVAHQRQVAERSALDVLIADTENAGQLEWPAAVFGPAEQEAAASGRESFVADEGAGEDIAYILFTSGSTGQPKGVPVSHTNLAAFLEAEIPRFEVGQEDVFSQVCEFTFDVSMFEMFVGWGTGSCVCPISKYQAANPPRCVAERGITVWTSTPSLVAMLMSGDRLPPGAMPGLRYTVFCGEPLTVATANYWQQAAPASRLDNLYGPTEATVGCTVFRLEPGSGALRGLADSDTVPIGRPLYGTDCLLLDSEGNPNACLGELCVTGPQVFNGYLQPHTGTDHFVIRAGRIWYRTGDQVKRTEHGELVHLGRTDEQVKVNGYRVELAGIELAIRRRLPDTVCGVVAVRDASGLASLVAFITGHTERLDELRRKLAQELPIYMVPARFCSLPELPLNHSGKVDRAKLRELASKPHHV